MRRHGSPRRGRLSIALAREDGAVGLAYAAALTDDVLSIIVKNGDRAPVSDILQGLRGNWLRASTPDSGRRWSLEQGDRLEDVLEHLGFEIERTYGPGGTTRSQHVTV